MIYSYLLRVEHKNPDIGSHEESYTVFSTHYPYGKLVKSDSDLLMHNFAVLWNNNTNNSVIVFIEPDITLDAFSPTKIIHLHKNTLTNVYNEQLDEIHLNNIMRTWTTIALSVSNNDWMLETLNEMEVSSSTKINLPPRNNSHIIMAYHDLGIKNASLSPV